MSIITTKTFKTDQRRLKKMQEPLNFQLPFATFIRELSKCKNTSSKVIVAVPHGRTLRKGTLSLTEFLSENKICSFVKQMS